MSRISGQPSGQTLWAVHAVYRQRERESRMSETLFVFATDEAGAILAMLAEAPAYITSNLIGSPTVEPASDRHRPTTYPYSSLGRYRSWRRFP